MLAALTDGVWIESAPVSFLGLRLTSNMTVLRISDGNVLVHSPIVLTPERRAAVEALGRVAHLYAPNTFHHQWLGEWATAFPDALLHAPAGLAGKRPDLKIVRAHGAQLEPAFSGVLDEIPIAGFFLEESALVHRPSRTLVVADLVANVGRPTHRWTATYTKLAGFYDQVAISRVLRWTSFQDKKSARRCVDEVLAHPFERLVVGHGESVAANARNALAAAYAWLPVSA
jgi:hypothetical protein